MVLREQCKSCGGLHANRLKALNHQYLLQRYTLKTIVEYLYPFEERLLHG